METLATLLPWIQVVLSILLVALILTQKTDAALGSAFGGSGGENIARQRRGAELFVFRFTIAIAVLFAASAILALVV